MLVLLVNQISRSFSTPSKNCTLSVLSSFVVAILRGHDNYFLHNYDIRENKQKFLSLVCVSLQMYDTPVLSPNFALLLRTSDRAIVLAVVSVSPTLAVCMRNIMSSISFQLLRVTSLSNYCLYLRCVRSLFYQSQVTFVACAQQSVLFKIKFIL